MRKIWTAVGSVVMTTALLVQPLTYSAFAATYPSWTDVLNARNNVAAKKRAISQLEAFLKELNAKVEAAQNEAQRLGEIYMVAQEKFDEAEFLAQALQNQADEAQRQAEKSRTRAGQFVSELARAGSVNLTTSLFTSAENADGLLLKLGFASKIAEQADGMYQVALGDQRTAQALTDKATVAMELRDQLRDEAEASFNKAQEASNAAMAAYDEQQENEARLKAQLATLITNQKKTEADYQKGQEENGGNLGSDAPAGWVSDEGWAKVAGGYISSPYGMRFHPVFKTRKLHTGVDLAPGCRAPIYAAHEGTVVYAGPGGAYGNLIKIDHGGGIVTWYAHIVDGGFKVRFGDRVSAGTRIALVGSTGASTGCHLHFEVRSGGSVVNPGNPVPFMRDRGVRLG